MINIERKDRLIVITNNDFKVVLSSLGASIVSIYIGEDILTMTPINLDDLNRKDIYYGQTIGPIANRVKYGLVKIDNKEYHFSLNEKGVSLHSGDIGLSNQLFNADIENNKVTFTYIQHIEEVIISYIVIYSFNDYQIRIDFLVRTNHKFMINLTNHSYFTLGEPSIDNLSLQIKADSFIETEKETLLPLISRPIIDCLDFNNGKLIIKDINDPYLKDHRSNGYDHSFILSKKEIKLESTKYVLDIKTDYPCVQIYSDNYIDNVKTINSNRLKERGIAIEPTDNMLKRPIIDKDEVYQRYIIYNFKKK